MTASRVYSNAPRLQKFQMYREIEEQPQILGRIWDHRQTVARLAKKLSKSAPVLFTAFGSSYNASLYGQLLFYRYLGIPAYVATPGFWLAAPERVRMKGGLLIAVSQSGKVREVIEAVRLLKRKGIRTLAVTNSADSPLARKCDEVLLLGAGAEKSVPATKTFTATLLNLQLLIAYWGARSLLPKLALTEEICRQVLAEKRSATALAAKLSSASRGFVISSESLKPIACEGGLKLNECAYFMAEPFEWREFFHGPIALAQREAPAVFLSDPEKRSASAGAIKLLKRRGVRAYSLKLPKSAAITDTNLAAIPYAMLLQILALSLAIRKGRNPDHPRFLHKVTQTPLGSE